MDTKAMLEQLCQSSGVAGCEYEAAETAVRLCREMGLGEARITPLRSVICPVRPAKEGAPHLLLNAHIDEIGMIVTHVEDSGFLRVNRSGGVDRRLLMGSPVWVHTDEGALPGVIGSVPPHLQEGEQKNPTWEETYVDVGLTGEEAKARIPLGSYITFEGPFTCLQGSLVSSKALDDRCGCVAVLMAAQQLKDAPGDFGLTVLLSSMEETNGAGAHTGAWTVAPTHSLVVDVTFGETPEIKEHHPGKLGGGPMVAFAALLDRQMGRDLVRLARENNIPVQIEGAGGSSTGTDADSIAPSRAGVRTCGIGIPERYMHTPIEVIDIQDVENTARLMVLYTTHCL